MDRATPLPGNWPTAIHDAQAQVKALAEQARRTVSVARGLLDAGRRVDLAGLDRGVGLLCAKALDLPPNQGRITRGELIQLAADLDALEQAMRSSTP